MREGFPSKPRDDLRYYLDQDGRVTRRLRAHFSPIRTRPDERVLFIKCGATSMRGEVWMLRRGVVFAVMDVDGKFITWKEDGSRWIVAVDDPVCGVTGEWGVRMRKPTAQELLDA